MAIDQTEKRRNIARQVVQRGPALMDVLYSLDAIRAQREHAGPGGTPLVFTDADFTDQAGLTHLDAATVHAFFAAIPTLLNAFANQNFNDVFEAVRP